ncbi:MAG: bifunctional UDP-N-acetylglucosamine diphosphorylase/glucosamine-1-phosphate N-acetyltransferase GlmU [Gammaproteobacteria bacterium]|nr:bifunctional UDP-N-acetylglucosamine diphosphorylase/glucosamine-1-phosphate N-acetyltransferase GlmU [Gammaproteobacteria bacterium]
MNLSVVILAAGKGKRMASQLPKVLHPVGGTSMLERVVDTAKAIQANSIHVIYGNGGAEVKAQLPHLDVNWVWQEKQLGTGHAVAQALPFCNDDDRILVLYGDVPLISPQTLQQLLTETPVGGLGLIVADLENPTGLGRIIRNELGNIIAIVEHKDATPQQLQIQEINTGILTATAKHLKEWLPRLNNQNKQKEYYLTDTIALAVSEGVSVGGVLAHCAEEVLGVNDRWQLANIERYYQVMQARRLAFSGVTIMDPARLAIRGKADVAQDVTLDINVILEGNVCIGKNSIIGPNVVIKNSRIGENVVVHANSVIEGAEVYDAAEIGPFARVRPGTQVQTRAKVGNFVEIKKTVLGAGSKVGHLSYLGDAVIGKQVNIGAGTITCNYDGVNKWPTKVGDYCFIGSNTSLVAPLNIGASATIAAGSTITEDAPADKLSIGRTRQTVIADWQRPKKTAEVN